MGILYDNVVIVRQSEKEGEASVITANCPDKTGLGCDLCRLIGMWDFCDSFVHFVSTDGKWCCIVFWVIGKLTTRWGLLKKKLVGACPSCSSASGISFYRSELQPPKPPDVFLVKFCCFDRRGLLHDGKKIVDPSKQASLCSHIWAEALRPLPVALVNRGPDTDLLVANPVELSGKGRALVFYVITLALKMLNTGIVLAEIGRHMIGDREWEVYKVLLDEGDGFSVPTNQIEETVWKMLMGWEL